ncbi:CopG family transcriptional regulator [Nitrosomonas sp. JL21]|nr:CopG family transcriptional regulator [Nitrosomonas sp.]MBL8498452.1 CopG family transcriptional regulator [Nitrosomonas sp.]MXS78130.1 CopG family transcriptional regulator [Nitrosomonas sp. JL21]
MPPTSHKLIRRTKANIACRTSVTFPPELYEALEAIARSKKVSIAWVVRDAAEKYVANETSRK